MKVILIFFSELMSMKKFESKIKAVNMKNKFMYILKLNFDKDI